MSRYYSNDRLGNLWTIDGTSKNQLNYEDFSGFGTPVASGGDPTPFKFGGGNGCQTDETGLVLMGHRYYDQRVGRFISRDPAGDGDNWYAYAGNNPVNKTDPSGLHIIFAPKPYDGSFGNDPGGLFGGNAGGLFGGTGIRDGFFDSGDDTGGQSAFMSSQSGSSNKTQLVIDNIQIVLNFLLGQGPDQEIYNMDNLRVQQFMNSLDAMQIGIQLAMDGWPALDKGNIGTVQTFNNSVSDISNDIEWQLGAVGWSSHRDGRYEDIQVNNIISWNSLAYHIPEKLGWKTNNPLGDGRVLSDIGQTLFYRQPLPKGAK